LSQTEKHTNRLAKETSPYLLQHQHNPVDWYPWGPEAFEKAVAEDKPILLSVGYSACHWCHVMERESFENEAIAELMNDHFVSIKVDREERPDVDHIYMQVVTAMTGHGGWPMTVIMTPTGEPIFGGTYFPPQDGRGLPGFPRVLTAVAKTYREQGQEASKAGRHLMERIEQSERPQQRGDLLTGAILQTAFQNLSRSFDDQHGGQNRAPKFPQPMTWESVLRYAARTGNPRAEEMIRLTLTRMARGGMYDQLGGGFHRYSVDDRWLVPHFEKMLYDNGQLARLFLDAYLACGDPEYRRITEEVLDYIAREMRDDSGGFYSAQDADSEGVEGKFFVWEPEELRSLILDSDVLEAALAYWGMEGPPNFEGNYILNVPQEPSTVAEQLGIDETTLWNRVLEARRILFEERETRIKPGLDKKVLSAWNGLAARAFAEAGRALGRSDYVDIAVANVDFVLTQMRRDDGRLLRTWKDGNAHLLAYLVDYANTIDALLAVYQATFDVTRFYQARELADAMLELFWDEKRAGFYDTGTDHEALIIRPRETFDNASPSGNSVAVDVLLKLTAVSGDPKYTAPALTSLRSSARMMSRHPAGFGRLLCALDFYVGPVIEVALVWPEDGSPDPLLGPIFTRYQPNRVVVGAAAGSAPSGIPLLDNRDALDGETTAYVCQQMVCKLPVTDEKALTAQLAGFEL
jgi:uncharacterized protein YyaL (SSP411 family)